MPAWTNDPSAPVAGLLSGQVRYAAGSKALGPTCYMIIDHVAVAANVVTLTVTIREGNIPAVGDLIYVYATTQNSGALNTTVGIAISGVSITAATGKGTITYPKTTGNLGSIVDTGYAQSVPTEIGETLAQQAYQAFAVNPTAGYGITWSYSCPSAPGSIAIQLEGAIDNVDAQYELIGTSQTTTSGSTGNFATLPELVRFVRINVTAASGGSSPTLIAKLLQS